MWIGEGYINTDPLFTDPEYGGYSLQAASPCIDSGDPTTYDEDGTISDMGAFAFAFEFHFYLVEMYYNMI